MKKTETKIPKKFPGGAEQQTQGTEKETYMGSMLKKAMSKKK